MEPIGAIRSLIAAIALVLVICPRGQASSAANGVVIGSGEIWIAARTDGITGTGSALNPCDGSTQAKFDSLMAAIPPNRIIHFGPGTFVTRGIVPKSGWWLYLSPQTTLRMDVIPSIPGHKWAIFGAGSHDSVANVRIEGGVWDCNLQNQVVPMAAQAIAFIAGGGNVKIRGVKAINWGSTLPVAECFVVSVFNVGQTGKIAHDIVFDDVEVTQPAPIKHLGSSSLIGAQGQDAVDLKALSKGWLQNVEIKNCYVHDIDLPVMIASIQMGGWCDGVHIHHNRFQNLGPKNNTLFGCYLDTGGSDHLLVEKNVFAGVVHSIWASLTTPYSVKNWVIRDNRIAINRNTLSGGIELRGMNTTIRNVLVERNIIFSVNGQNLNTCGIALNKVNGGVLRENVIDGINGSAHIVYEKEVSAIELSNNRRRNGLTIPVKR